jgi:hypothetical protein
MTAKLDGTAGLLQQYDYQTPTTGFSYTFAAGVNVLVMQPAGTLATGTVTMPSAPVDGMTITVESTQQITALTVQGNTGQSLVNGTQTLRPNQPYSWVYRLSNTTWYPFAGATNSQIVSGVSQASTSGTSIDFTGIPAWVKRVTVMFQGVSTNGASEYVVRIGDSGGIASTGYTGAYAINASASLSTTGFGISNGSSATATIMSGTVVITALDLATYKYTCMGMLGESDVARMTYTAGAKTLSGVLDRVRITTINGTDTFDAGSINILYE